LKKTNGLFFLLLSLSAGYFGGQISSYNPVYAGPSKVQYDEIKAKKVVVIDDKGKTRGEFSCADNLVGLTLTDVNGQPKCTINVETDGPGLMFLGKNGQMKCAIKIIEDSSAMYFFDAKGKTILKLP